MSVRSAERSKAVRLAWEREQELVSKGKCTRDWTRQQQQDILDPDKGKAYDDKGRAFEGQHMKCVKLYPEYADDPDNIQFLTKDEHLEAHRGSWNNPTNGYYDPITKSVSEFGEDELIPCEIVDLSNPIVAAILTEQTEKNADEARTAEKKEETHAKAFETRDLDADQSTAKTENKSAGVESAPKPLGTINASKRGNGFINGLKSVGRFIVEHPQESIQIAGVVAMGLANGISLIRGQDNNRINSDKSTNDFSTNLSSNVPDKSDMASTIADIVEKATRSSPHEHEVPGHKQRYHTKDGVVWRDKDPYSRGRKKS